MSAVIWTMCCPRPHPCHCHHTDDNDNDNNNTVDDSKKRQEKGQRVDSTSEMVIVKHHHYHYLPSRSIIRGDTNTWLKLGWSTGDSCGVVPGVNLGPRSGVILLYGGCCCEREAENASRKGSGGIPRWI